MLSAGAKRMSASAALSRAKSHSLEISSSLMVHAGCECVACERGNPVCAKDGTYQGLVIHAVHNAKFTIMAAPQGSGDGGCKRRVGIVGYGKLGKFLAHAVVESVDMELAFVWNRRPEPVLADDVVCAHHLPDLKDAAQRNPDIIVEVAHPQITKDHGEFLISIADYFVGSPSGFADAAVEHSMRAAASSGKHGMYVPSGALWGCADINKMAELGTLKGLTVTMRKHPSCFRLNGPLADRCRAAEAEQGEVTLYEGPVRALCPQAPNNVNTMAAAALSAHSLGFDKVQGRLVVDTRLEAHVVEIEAVGPGSPPFTVKTVRYNPALPGAVTGNATYNSFLSSLKRSGGRGNGVHFC
eukprot:m.211927 g.211927  ORF g.211927 m.211927 type:complete len:355 (+) comp18582_c0_seq2:1574-2638(+)